MNNKYQENLINTAIKLENTLNNGSEILFEVRKIVEKHDKMAIAKLVKMISDIVETQFISKEILLLTKVLKDNLIQYYGYYSIQEIFNKNIIKEKNIDLTNEEYNIKELMDELNELVGLKNVKEKVNDLFAYQKVKKLRKEAGLYTANNTMHLAFTGNPGSGKTTVARIVGRIYKQLGLLSKGQFIEVSRTDLIAGYQGQTALKVREVIERAKGGVLFIDEAYSITENDQSDSYGRECLTELTKALEDYRDDLVVIVAGYTEPMNNFFSANQGLKSRFNNFIEFDDYNIQELEEILEMMCRKNNFVIDKVAKEKIRKLLEKNIVDLKDNFSNGRFVRNIYEDLIMNHARRVAKLEMINREILQQIIVDDVNVEVDY